MTTAAEQAGAAWAELPSRERVELTRAAARGQRGANPRDAAYMLWWTQHELERGPWPGIRLAVVAVVALLAYQVVLTGLRFDDLENLLAQLGLLPIIPLIPAASWTLRRPKLKQSAQLNAAVLAGRSFDGPPDPDEAERLLARARKEGWFRGTRPEPDS